MTHNHHLNNSTSSNNTDSSSKRSTLLHPLSNIPGPASYKKGDVLVVFGELFTRGYANGIVEEAEKHGLTIVRSTVGRRDASSNNQLRALHQDELASMPQPFINRPLEAGFDLEPHNGDEATGESPVSTLQSLKMNEWNKPVLDWAKVQASKERGIARFQHHLRLYMQDLQAFLDDHLKKYPSANLIFVHTMAGGVPRAKILMPTMNKVFKGTGDRHIPSADFWNSDIGKLSAQNFDEVTANTFEHLIEMSGSVRQKIESQGGQVRYLAYGYHGTEVLVGEKYIWQTYTPYVQGWAKIKLEQIAQKAWDKGISAQVFNCPEILTNSSSIFLGVEVSLYPLLGALRFESKRQGSQINTNLWNECVERLKPEHNADEILTFTDQYMTSDWIQPFFDFPNWPLHNKKEQMEKMLEASAHLIQMNKDSKDLITNVLSEAVFQATGYLMFHESWKPTKPVLWIGHDVIARWLNQIKR